LKRLARKSALSQKALDKKITIIEDFTFEAPKTKQCIELLQNMSFDTRKVLLVLSNMDKNVILSSRNLEGFKVAQASDLNTLDILNCSQLVLSEKSIPVIETVLSAQ
jgi:large subunit ribosomal protein L4